MVRPIAHVEAQRLGKVRDDYTCAICCERIPPEESDYKYQVEGHHIFEYSEGGSAAIENIITLCYDCHLAYHRGKIEIDISDF